MRLTKQVADDIRLCAEANWPDECCGIVLAHREAPGLGVLVLRSRNVTRLDPRRNYRLDRAVHIRAVEAEVARGAVILGYYHSHAAGPAEPSRADAELACPGVTYLVASARELRAWTWDGERFREEAVVVHDCQVPAGGSYRTWEEPAREDVIEKLVEELVEEFNEELNKELVSAGEV